MNRAHLRDDAPLVIALVATLAYSIAAMAVMLTLLFNTAPVPAPTPPPGWYTEYVAGIGVLWCLDDPQPGIARECASPTQFKGFPR